MIRSSLDGLFDIERARRETPGCERVLHFNNAGASLPPECVVETSIAYLRREAKIGGYEAQFEHDDAVEGVYRSAARLIGARREEIALMESATRAWDMAFYGLLLAPGDRILTAYAEYPGNYVALLHRARQTGAVIDVLPDDPQGQVSLDALREAVARHGTKIKLIALTHIPTDNGLINPAAEVGRLAREADIPYLLDACQSVGQMPLHVEEIGCDMLAATGRKYLRGPRGTGFLYVKRSFAERLEPPLLDHTAAPLAGGAYELWPDARRFETWETNFAARLGLGVAIDYALSWGLEAIEKRVQSLASQLRERLRRLPRVTVRDRGAQQCGIVTFTVEGTSPADLWRRLGAQNIHVYPREITPMDRPGEPIPILRASVHYYNSEEEIEQFCAALETLIDA